MKGSVETSRIDDVLVYPDNAVIGDRYQVMRSLIGGMGVVYLCIDTQDESRVALKTFKHLAGPQQILTHKIRVRFIQECAAWIRLGKHPHIVLAHRIERIQDWHGIYLVLEWVGSDNEKHCPELRRRLIQQNIFEPKHALTIALHVARGMQRATTLFPGLVHGDLKPDNLLIDTIGQIKIADFGMSGVWTGHNAEPLQEVEAPNALQDGALRHRAGTRHYSAPEIWTTGASVDCRADIYALGCIVFELLSGKQIVSGESAEQLGNAHIRGELREFPDDLTPGTSDFLNRCLALKPGHRYADWDALTGAIAALFRSDFGIQPAECPVPEPGSQDDVIATAWSQHTLGTAAAELGRHHEAKFAYEQSLELANSIHVPELMQSSLEGLGASQAALGSVNQGIDTLLQSSEFARSSNDKDRIDAILGGLYVEKGDTSRAIRLLEPLSARLQAEKTGQNSSLTLGNLAIAYAASGSTDRAIAAFQKLVTRATDTQDPYLLGQALGGLGAALLDAGRTQEALEVLGQSLSSAWQTGDEACVGWAFANGAAARYALAEYDVAMAAYREAWRSGAQMGDPKLEATARGGVGACQVKLHDLPNAIVNLGDALASFRKINDQAGISRTTKLLGNILIEENIDPVRGRDILNHHST